MIAIVLLVVLLVVALVGLAIGLSDRVCSGVAERRAADYLSTPFGHRPTVRVHGTPFLTQALRGRYDDIEVSGGGLRVGELAGVTLDAHLHGVLLPVRELLGARTGVLRCGRVEGRLVLPYGELARVSPIPGLGLNYDRGRLVASTSLPIPGISALARVSGEALLTVTAAGAVWLRVRDLSVAGISVPGMVLKQLMPSFTVPIPLAPLPYGLGLDGIEAAPAGLVVRGSANDVVFTAERPAHPVSH